MIKKAMYFILPFTLIGCIEMNKPALKTDSLQKEVQVVPVSKTSHLRLSKAWPLKNQGTYLQKVSTTIQGETQSFSVHLTLEDQKLEAIAFNDAFGRLYHLIWTPITLSWDGSDHIPNTLQPDSIIADFLLSYLPLKQLQTVLEGAQVREEKRNKESVRWIESQSSVLRKIHRYNSMEYLWEKVTIHNPEVGYQLDIQTVPLP